MELRILYKNNVYPINGLSDDDAKTVIDIIKESDQFFYYERIGNIVIEIPAYKVGELWFTYKDGRKIVDILLEDIECIPYHTS